MGKCTLTGSKNFSYVEKMRTSAYVSHRKPSHQCAGTVGLRKRPASGSRCCFLSSTGPSERGCGHFAGNVPAPPKPRAVRLESRLIRLITLITFVRTCIQLPLTLDQGFLTSASLWSLNFRAEVRIPELPSFRMDMERPAIVVAKHWCRSTKNGSQWSSARSDNTGREKTRLPCPEGRPIVVIVLLIHSEKVQ